MAIQMNKNALLLVLGYLGTVGGAVGGGYYAYEAYKEARNEEAEVKKLIEMADIKIKRVSNLEVDVICLRENVSELVRILPNSREVNEFVNKLNDFAAESHLRIDSLHDEKDRGKQKDVFDKVTYKLQVMGNVEQFLAFLSLCEGWERFVRVTSISVKAGEWDEDRQREDIVHEISVELQTYSYRGHDDAIAKATVIHNYDNRRDSLKDEIISRRADIRVERYNLVPNPLRRDPFVDPRRRLTDEGDGGLPYADQKAMVDLFVSRAEELHALAEAVTQPATNFIRRLELETEIDTKSQLLKADLDKALSANSVSDTSLKRRIEREVLPTVKSLLERDQQASAAATLEDLRRYSRDMALLLQEAKYEEVMKRHKIIKGRVNVAQLSPESAAVLQLIDKSARNAEVALEFSKKDMEIGGAIVAKSGSVVVVNGHVLKEGDALEDGCVVHRISPDRIEFRYRGVVLARAR